MKVRLLTCLSGADFTRDVGDEHDCVSADEAKRLVDAGIAEYIRTAPVEKAVKRSKVEKAAK